VRPHLFYDRMNHGLTCPSERRRPIERSRQPRGPPSEHPLSIHCLRSLSQWLRWDHPTTQGKDPMMGPGQGNGWAPAGLSSLSSVLVRMMRKLGFGAWILCPHHVACLCFIFVDDSDLIITARIIHPVVNNWWRRHSGCQPLGRRTQGYRRRQPTLVLLFLLRLCMERQLEYRKKSSMPGNIKVTTMPADQSPSNGTRRTRPT
jgi:hypothetical protein